MRPEVSKPPQMPVIVIIGATGTGKSDLAVELAEHFNGEVINSDAMQMYHGLPILTNKIDVVAQRCVPHHLLGHVPLHAPPWTVNDFKREALRLMRDVRSRGRVPVIVGGTSYYLLSLFGDQLVEERETRHEGEDELGDHLEPTIDTEGENRNGNDDQRPKTAAGKYFMNEHDLAILDGPTEGILARLSEVDPDMANRWHPCDRRKIRRSLEICLQTGRRASDIYAEQRARHAAKIRAVGDTRGQDMDHVLVFWVFSEIEALKERLERRVDKMLQHGLLDEVREVYDFAAKETADGHGVDMTVGIWQAIGIKQFWPYVEATRSADQTATIVERLYADAIDATKAATRRLARYQIRYNRTKLLPHLLAFSGNESVGSTVNSHAGPAPAAQASTSQAPPFRISQHDGSQKAQLSSEPSLPSPVPSVVKLYVVDSTDQGQWSDQVSKPALSIAGLFLRGDSLPPSENTSGVAPGVLEQIRESVAGLLSPTTFTKRFCALCVTTAVRDADWEIHLKSRGHRKASRAAFRTALVPYVPKPRDLIVRALDCSIWNSEPYADEKPL